MPRNTAPRASGRTLDEYLETPEAVEMIGGAGISKTAARESVARIAADQGIRGRFASLSAEDQDALAREAILPRRAAGGRTIQVGGAFGGEPSPLAIANLETRLVPETEIRETVIFAGAGTSTEYRKRNRLCELYGGDSWKWAHVAGEGWAFFPADGRIRRAELHWAEEPTVGIRELRVNRWLEDHEG